MVRHDFISRSLRMLDKSGQTSKSIRTFSGLDSGLTDIGAQDFIDGFNLLSVPQATHGVIVNRGELVEIP